MQYQAKSHRREPWEQHASDLRAAPTQGLDAHLYPHTSRLAGVGIREVYIIQVLLALLP